MGTRWPGHCCLSLIEDGIVLDGDLIGDGGGGDDGDGRDERMGTSGVTGEEIPLALETLDGASRPVAPKGFLFPPVHAISETTQSALEQEPKPTDAPVRVATARRLSDNPASPYYNLYLSRPIALLYEEVTPEALASVFKSIDEMKKVVVLEKRPQVIDFYDPFFVPALSVLGISVLALFGLRFTPW